MSRDTRWRHRFQATPTLLRVHFCFWGFARTYTRLTLRAPAARHTRARRHGYSIHCTPLGNTAKHSAPRMTHPIHCFPPAVSMYRFLRPELVPSFTTSNYLKINKNFKNFWKYFAKIIDIIQENFKIFSKIKKKLLEKLFEISLFFSFIQISFLNFKSI